MKKIIVLVTCFTIGIAAEGKIGGVTYFEDESDSVTEYKINFQFKF